VPHQGAGGGSGGSGDAGAGGRGGAPPPDERPQDLSEEEEAARAQLAKLREQVLAAPAEDVVANHAYGLFELAAIHLSAEPPSLAAARLAIDALGALVEGLGDRLCHSAGGLREGLAQIRLAFVQIAQAAPSGDGAPEPAPAPAPAPEAPPAEP
jgi:hypothetical protein